MTDNNNQIIYCPYCKVPITVDELGEYVNVNPETKKQAIEEELELWGDVYDRVINTIGQQGFEVKELEVDAEKEK